MQSFVPFLKCPLSLPFVVSLVIVLECSLILTAAEQPPSSSVPEIKNSNEITQKN